MASARRQLAIASSSLPCFCSTRPRLIGIEREHLLIADECSVQFALMQQHVAEIAMGIGMVGIERQDLLQTGTRLIHDEREVCHRSRSAAAWPS